MSSETVLQKMVGRTLVSADEAETRLNEFLRRVQRKIGVDSGDRAAHFFDGMREGRAAIHAIRYGQPADLQRVMCDYLAMERQSATPQQAVRIAALARGCPTRQVRW